MPHAGAAACRAVRTISTESPRATCLYRPGSSWRYPGPMSALRFAPPALLVPALLLALLLLAPLLAGCARTADRDEAAVCASAAAGLVAPVRLKVGGATPLAPDAEGRAGVRVVLAPEDPDVALPWLECRFAGRGPHPDLAALARSSGPVDETHLYFLKRFWLGSDEAADAAPEADEALVPELPFGVAYAIQQGLNALPDAAVYGLLAAAYSLVYGLSGRINLAFGEIAAVGGLAAVAGTAVARDQAAGPILVLALGLGVWAAALHGLAVERLVLWPLRRAPGQQALVATVGVALALREYLRLATGSQPKWVPPLLAEPARIARGGGFVITVTPMALLLAGGAAVASAGLLALFRFTAFGRDWRATADDPLAAALMGVDPRGLSLRTAILAAALVGAAGAGVTLNYGGIGFDYTTGLGLKALIAAIIGGIGSVPGAFLGGLAIAVFEALWSAVLPIGDRDLALDVMLVAVLTVRPGGFLGSRDPVARRMP